MEYITLKTAVIVIIALVFIGAATYWFLYTRGLHTKQATLAEEGRLPRSKEEGIAIATTDKEKAGRSGTIS